jgi:3,4-dihydroxy 2-butanone 4-phosphate synthase / GTP cyclohydrolase II
LAIAPILTTLKTWPSIARIEFLVSPGTDPLKTLQIQLDRQDSDWQDLPYPVMDYLETQKIYSVHR